MNKNQSTARGTRAPAGARRINRVRSSNHGDGSHPPRSSQPGRGRGGNRRFSGSNQTGNQHRRNNRRGGRTPQQQHKHRLNKTDRTDTIPPLEPGNIRIITLGGFEEIGKNMSAIEIGNDIIVIDCGFQFREDDTPGIDYILPNTKYLEDRQDRIRGVVITHGHLDHIGGIPYVWPRIGNPTIYCRYFTELMIRKRQEEFKHLPPIEIKTVETDDTIKLGDQIVRFFGITHTIPDSMGIIIETPYGNIINQADFKLDHVDGTVSDEEQKVYKSVGKEKTLVLMSDSTNIENEGFSTPEWKVHKDLEKIIAETDGRIIMGSFASQIERLVKVVEIAENYGRHVVFEGRSIRTNMEVAREAGIFKPKEKTIISGEESVNVPPHQVLVLATGSQGEEFAALMRMANKSHKTLHFSERDTVVLSSSIVPGNETSVAKLKDAIARSGARIITYRNSEFYVHGSGHGNREELRWLHDVLDPQFFIPQHGSHYMLRLHYQLARERGMDPKDIVVPDDGSIIEIRNQGTEIVKLKEKAMSDLVTVDGFNIGDMQDVVIRDRQLLSEDGIFIVVLAINPRDGRLRKSPDIISRGFVYLRESKELIQEARSTTIRIVEKFARANNRPYDFDQLKGQITDQLRKVLLQRTAKRPLVIPVVLGI